MKNNQQKHRRSIPTQVLLGASLFGLFGCAVSRSPIRIGVDDWLPCGVWAVAQAEGYFGSIPVNIVKFSNWSDSMESFYEGKLDLAHSTYFDSVFYAGKGEGAKMVACLDTIEGSDGFVISNKLSSPASLKGARIAVEVDTDEHFFLYKALADFGIPADSVLIVSAPSQKAGELFVAGKVDGCCTYNPYLADAAKRGGGRIAWTTRDAPGYMIDVLVARDQVISSRHADVALIVRAWFRALAFIKQHPAQSYAIMGSSLGMKPEELSPFFESFRFFTSQENQGMFASPELRARLGEMSAFLLHNNAIFLQPQMGSLYSSHFVDSIR